MTEISNESDEATIKVTATLDGTAYKSDLAINLKNIDHEDRLAEDGTTDLTEANLFLSGEVGDRFENATLPGDANAP